MSSAHSQKNQVSANKLYINITAVQSTIVDTNLSTVSWVVGNTALATAGGAVFRDMGKTVYLPDPTTASSANGQSTILRKIQLIPSGTNGVYGTGAGTGGAAAGGAQEYYTGYIRLGGQTYGGGDGFPTGCAMLN
jgi:hypothetical protein